MVMEQLYADNRTQIRSRVQPVTIAPQISVVICTYNRDRSVERALASLTQQTLAADQFEIIVVDNKSTDSTAQVVEAFINRHTQFSIRYFYEPSPGVSNARNAGIEKARAPFITYMDDDAYAESSFLENMLRFLAANPLADGVGGRVLPRYPENKEPGWMNSFLNGFVALTDYGNQARLYTGKMKYPVGCNMTYRKDVLLKAGGFHTQLTFRSEDKYIYFQLRKFTNQIYYLPDALVYHHMEEARLSFPYFKKLFQKTGNEEKVRLRAQNETFSLFKKGAELLLKTIIASVIYFFYAAGGQERRGRYVFFSQWFTLNGFFMKDVFFR